MSLEFTVDELKEIKYAAATVKLKNKADETVDDHKITGLLLGMQPLVPHNTGLTSKDDVYIWLSEGDNCHILLTKYYEIDSIFIGKGPCDFTFTGRPDDVDQENSRLVTIHRAMKLANRVSPNELIDVSTYEIPSHMKKMLGEDISVGNADSTKSTSNHNRSGGVSHSYASCGYTSRPNTSYTTSPYKKKEVATKLFKRTTRYSANDAIESMWAKITEIREGTYKPPKLKTLKEEEAPKNVANATSNQQSQISDDEYGEYGSYGGFF